MKLQTKKNMFLLMISTDQQALSKSCLQKVVRLTKSHFHDTFLLNELQIRNFINTAQPSEP